MLSLTKKGLLNSLHITHYDFNMTAEQEKLKKISISIEEEVLEAIEELAEEYSRETGRKWSKGAVIRVALSEFFSKRGKIL